LEFGEALVSKVVADMAEEVSAAGFSVEEFPVVLHRNAKYRYTSPLLNRR
jgi:hypothetical protein